MGGAMSSHSNDFSISGPDHLKSIDWNNSDRRTTVAARVIKVVYKMQRDKAKEREPLAHPWWEFFGFSLDKHLINEADGSIYGTVFKYDYENTPHSGVPPRYVIAFRGRMLSLETGFSDMKQDLRCFANNLDCSKRFEHAIEAIKTVLAKPTTGETTSVWLAGHSLGAGIALLAGKISVRMGYPVETYAFNPPRKFLPQETIPGCNVFKYGFTSGRGRKMGGGAMISDRDDFSISGPIHLTFIDWDDSDHRTAVVASLVQGVYTMQRNKAEELPLANLWWKFFGFSLEEHLINEGDGSLYGAVFKYDNNKNTHHSGVPPRYVIAFRGTMLAFKTVFSDLKQDLRCIFTNLIDGKRYGHTIQAIKTVLDKTPTGETTSVWLAGHSLGAAIALLAGKAMARLGSLLKTYAFNPPRPSLPIETLIPGSYALKFGARLIKSLTEATLVGLAMLINLQIQEDDLRTAKWIPYLYVHPADIICAEYIGEFKYKSFMSYVGLNDIDNAADKFPLRSLFFRGEGRQLPSSADMTVNCNKSTDSKTAHKPKQWWKFSKTAHGLEQWWETDPALLANWKTQHIRPSIQY